MGRSNDFYDSRPMWIAEPKKPLHGGWRLLERMDTRRDSNRRQLRSKDFRRISDQATGEERRTPDEPAGRPKQLN